MSSDDCQLVSEADAPFHNETISEIIARQWWGGMHPEALRPDNRTRFDINKRLPSNMIALVCCSVRFYVYIYG